MPMHTGVNTSKRQIKYSVNLKGSLPAAVKVFTQPSYISENLALADLINGADCLAGEVVVFDRGIQMRSAFDRFTRDGKLFIGRSKTAVKHKVVSEEKISDKPKEATASITSDVKCYLFNEMNKPTENRYRVIRGVIDKSCE